MEARLPTFGAAPDSRLQRQRPSPPTTGSPRDGRAGTSRTPAPPRTHRGQGRGVRQAPEATPLPITIQCGGNGTRTGRINALGLFPEAQKPCSIFLWPEHGPVVCRDSRGVNSPRAVLLTEHLVLRQQIILCCSARCPTIGGEARKPGPNAIFPSPAKTRITELTTRTYTRPICPDLSLYPSQTHEPPRAHGDSMRLGEAIKKAHGGPRTIQEEWSHEH